MMFLFVPQATTNFGDDDNVIITDGNVGTVRTGCEDTTYLK